MPGQQREVVITGAGAGIGRAAVRESARRCARVTLFHRNVERLETPRVEIGPQHHVAASTSPRGRAVALSCRPGPALSAPRPG